jgi:hypothetical protein
VRLPGETPEALRAKYAFDSFAQFVELWLAMHSSFVDTTAYERMADGYIAGALSTPTVCASASALRRWLIWLTRIWLIQVRECRLTRQEL